MTVKTSLLLQITGVSLIALQLIGCGDGGAGGSGGIQRQGQATVQFSGTRGQADVYYGRETTNSRMYCSVRSGTLDIEMTENYSPDNGGVWDSRVEMLFHNNVVPEGRMELQNNPNTEIRVFRGLDSQGRPEAYSIFKQGGDCYIKAKRTGDQLDGSFSCSGLWTEPLDRVVGVSGSFSCPVYSW